MTTQFFATPRYNFEFHFTNQGSDLDIYNDDDGLLVASFVGDRAIKMLNLLMAFPTTTERDIYIDSRIAHLINMDF